MRFRTLVIATMLAVPSSNLPAAARLQLDDKAYVWPKADRSAKIDFTNRMGRAMIKVSPDLNNEYFLRCLEETANIGDTKDLTLGDFVRTCISMNAERSTD